MPPSRPRIFVLHADPGLSRVLRDATRDRFVLTPANGWEHLNDLVRASPPGAYAVVDPFAGSGGRELSPHLDAVVRGSPGVSVVAAARLGPGDGPLLSALDEAGVSGLIVLGQDDTPEAVRQCLRRARGRAFQQMVADVLPPFIFGRRRRLILTAVEAVCAGGRAADFAGLIGVSEVTAVRRCTQEHLPTPRRLLAWMRMLLAARLLDQGRRVQEVARASGYAAESPLRTALRDLVGESARPMRSRGAMRTAMDALVAEIRAKRDAAREAARLARPARPRRKGKGKGKGKGRGGAKGDAGAADDAS